SMVLDADDREGLVHELQAFGLEPIIDATGLIRIAYDGLTPQPILSRIRTPLSVLRVHDPSLEDAYVALLRRPDEEAVA
ncbi:MAG: ABC transporter ATP-binding protein, partial [Acidimicrobiia bacterium]